MGYQYKRSIFSYLCVIMTTVDTSSIYIPLYKKKPHTNTYPVNFIIISETS